MEEFGIVFDLDGLLVDSEPLQEKAIRAVLARYGVRLRKSDFEAMVGLSTPRNFQDMIDLHGPFETLDRLLEQKNELYAEIALAELQPMPGAVPLVEAATRSSMPRAVASSSPVADVALSLEAVGLADLLTLRIGGDQVSATKPAPDLYLRALDLLGLPASRCVALEDTGHGVLSAKAAGLACVAVPNRHTMAQDLSAADLQVSSLTSLTLQDLAGLVTFG